MIERYALLNEPNHTMCIFEKNGKYYGHLLKEKTEKAPAKLVFETPKYDTVEAIKTAYPAKESAE